MIKRISSLVLLASLATPMAVAKPLVAELFVSQNCEACPAAIKVMSQKADMLQDDMLLLTWSVDYWDYLGEADPMALPEAADRQRAYAENMEIRGPYTPQVVFNGETHCPGNRVKAVDREMEYHQEADDAPIEISFDADARMMRIGDTGLDMDVNVSLVHYKTVKSGDEMLVNAVTKYQELERWNGHAADFEVTCDGDCVVLLQEPQFGEIIEAVMVPAAAGNYLPVTDGPGLKRGR